MAQQVRRQMNYVDGTAARQMYAAPARRVHEPERKAPSRRVAPQQRPQERPKVRRPKRRWHSPQDICCLWHLWYVWLLDQAY